MNFFYKLLERISRFLIKLIPAYYKNNHKFQNKNQITNTNSILSLLKKKINPNFILDIGCGYGEWFLKCYNFFPNSKYLLYDANKYNQKKLQELKKKYPSIIYKICLLSNEIKDLKFYNMGYGSSVYEEKTSFERTVEQITSTTLDIELKDLPINTTNNIIKLDVQGSEIDILRGLKDKINLFEVIILETSLKEYNKNSPLFFNVINFMESKNFHFYDLCDLKRLGNENSILVQFDSVFVKKNSKLLNFDFS